MYLFERSRKSLQLMFCYDFDFLIIKNYKQTFPDFPGLVQTLEK